MRKYLLASGKIINNTYEVFDKKTKMIEDARNFEHVINRYYGKNLKDISTFENAWQTDPNVVEYRRLMREIWGFKATDDVVSEIYVCDECKQNQDIFPFLSFWLSKDENDWTEEKIICQSCWNKSLYHEPTITKDNSVFRWIKIDPNNKHLAYKQRFIDKLIYQLYEAESFNDKKFFQKTYDNIFIQIEKQKETGDFSDEQKCQLYDLLEMIESKIP